MVEVVLKGMTKSLSGHPKSFVIGTFKAGVVLREEGGLFLTVDERKLSSELKELFDKRKQEQNTNEEIAPAFQNVQMIKEAVASTKLDEGQTWTDFDKNKDEVCPNMQFGKPCDCKDKRVHIKREAPYCPKCDTKGIACKGGTCFKPNKSTNWLCPRCFNEW
jgi:hypothetical protein